MMSRENALKAVEIISEEKVQVQQDRKKIYIAGPVTGVDGYRENFEKAEQILRRSGYEPVNPTAAGEVDGADYRYYINRGLRLLEDCDGIAMLPGFTDSPGARLEHRYAVTVDILIFGIDLDGSGGVLGAK